MSSMTPAELAQHLVRFDTTNPPGNEGPCLAWLRELFEVRGVRGRLFAASPDRPNLVVRVPGRGVAPPLLLQGHVDVVTSAGQAWARPPFAGELVDGWLWGRGALDMKGGVAMMVAALLRCLDADSPPAGDVVLCGLADEEAGGSCGAEFLVDHHPGLFEGIRHGIGEGGGMTQHLGGSVFYPITVAEKRSCRLRLRLHGPGGHASRAHRGGTMAKLGALLTALDGARLPVHLTPVAELHIRAVAGVLREPLRSRVLALLDPRRADAALGPLAGDGDRFESILRNTMNATLVAAGHKINVIPSEAVVDLDGRMLPGFEPHQFIEQVRSVVGPDPEIEVLNVGPRMPEPEMGALYDLLGSILVELDDQAVPVPSLMIGGTDQRHFAKLGIVGYGYLPLRLPSDQVLDTVHAADERVPVAALEFGAAAFDQLLHRYRG
jgi:acetylornithine deacetylase/succinyl-diaminopimelate desuccinylase-like protein